MTRHASIGEIDYIRTLKMTPGHKMSPEIVDEIVRYEGLGDEERAKLTEEEWYKTPGSSYGNETYWSDSLGGWHITGGAPPVYFDELPGNEAG